MHRPDRSKWNPLLTRRQLLRSAAVGSSALLTPRIAASADGQLGVADTGFLQPEELAAVEAITARIIPTGESIGAREAGVATYIQNLLSAFPSVDPNRDARRTAADVTRTVSVLGSGDANSDIDGDGRVTSGDVWGTILALFDGTPATAAWTAPQALHAGGPFSGRHPHPDPTTGTPSTSFPPNGFADPVPLPRVKRLAWMVRLLGAAAVPEVADNPLATSEADVDMRRRYRAGLARVDAIARSRFAGPYVELTAEQQDSVLEDLRQQDARFLDLITDHTIEGLLCDPHYGGNRNRVGWQLIGFDGDSQPLGYTIFDDTAQTYRERPDKPNSLPDPDDPCAAFSPEMLEFMRLVFVQLVPDGMEFPEPFCFGVST